jgi:DNA-binding transcriptional LysR family regulator
MAYQSEQGLAELSAFAAVVEHGGFSTAARVEGLRKATLVDRVRALEQRLGVTLLVRSTRMLRLTDAGHLFNAHARRAHAAADEAEAAAKQSNAKPTGLLRMTVSPLLSLRLLEGVIARYLRKYPDVSIELDGSLRPVDLVREGYDLAIRVGPLADSALSVRRLGLSYGGYYASRDYLKRRGKPSRPEELADHDTIAMQRGDRVPQWYFASGKRRRAVVIRPRLLVSSAETGVLAAAAGLGIVPCTHHIAKAGLAGGRLVPVLEAWTLPLLPVSAVFAPGRTPPPKTRLMIDELAAWFAAHHGHI